MASAPERITPAQLKAILAKPAKRRSKYNARKCVVDNITFDSVAEAKRYKELKLLEKAREIHDLVLQQEFPITINGKRVFSYFADFSYYIYKPGPMALNSQGIVEDVKGVQTKDFRIKWKCVQAAFPSWDWRIVKAR